MSDHRGKNKESNHSQNIEKLLRRASNDGFKDNIYQKKKRHIL